MKRVLTVLSLAVLITGCSTTGSNKAGLDGGSVTPINNQKLTTTFKRQGIKLGWGCVWGTGMSETTCVKNDELRFIEVTAYAPSNGNSEFARENAFTVAEMNAKAKLRKFINEDVYTSQVTNTLTKNVEKANDSIKNRIRSDEEVTMSDEEAGKDTNVAVRQNTNETVRTVTETIRVQAAGILRGVQAIDHQIVDRQTVKVTIRWDHESDNASKALTKIFR